ncbi:MAG: sigma 54-interacting transcriptional regulator [Myxococcales bacterium]|nr:sigma 54-interacting transcriptional regulator [Myxococcales bacterium]
MTDHTLPDPTQATPRDPGATPPALVVIEDDRSWRYVLPPAGAVTIGRVPECEVVLGDPTASRKHAQLRIDDGRAFVADLGSYNGTLVNGDAIAAERELRTGDVIQICTTMMVFHGGERRVEPPATVDDATLHQRLTLELDRASRYQRAVTIVAVRFATAGARDGALAAIRGAVRSIDTVGTDGATGVLALLPELGPDERGPAVASLTVALRGRGARVGWAAFPGDGVGAATLLASARAAAMAAPVDHAVAADALARRLTIGAATVVVAEPAMVRAFALIERFAVSDLPVLILGETGVGKDSAAVAVHHYSRRSGPLRTVNCAAIADGVVESELFGHERGAFSGAVATRIGLFEAAAGGTVFLDEVGELSLAVQAKLLRVLDGKAITRVGGTDDRAIDVRVVAATNRDLKAEAAAGRFREDLYYRLSGATVALPPLRERPRELPLLVRELLAAACARLGREPVEVTPAAMQVLARHRWPGNIRELKNALDYAAAACDGDAIDLWHLPPALVGDVEPGGGAVAAIRPADTASPGPRTAEGFRPIADELRALERKRMLQALRVADGVQTRAAELLRMPRRTFVAKMREYGLHAELGEKA